MHHAPFNVKKKFVSYAFFIKNVGLQWIEIRYRVTGKLCVVYETTIGTPIFSYFLNKFSYFFIFSYFLSAHAA